MNLLHASAPDEAIARAIVSPRVDDEGAFHARIIQRERAELKHVQAEDNVDTILLADAGHSNNMGG